MHAIVFDLKTKSAEITAEQLAMTMELGDGFGNMSPQCPMQPGKLLIYIKDLIRELCGIEPVQKPIVIKEQYCNTGRSKNDGDLQLSDYIIKRFVTKIELPIKAFEDKNEMFPAITLSYAYTDNLKGIQISFGENVSVCDNLTTFGPYTFSTYGNSKIKFDQGLQLMKYWLENFNRLHELHINAIQTMMSTPIEQSGYHKFLGVLFERSVQANAGMNVIAPLNQSQVAQLAVKGKTAFIKTNDPEKLVQPMQRDVSVWDIIMWGTDTLRPSNGDMVSYITNSAAFNEFVAESFDLQIDIAL